MNPSDQDLGVAATIEFTNGKSAQIITVAESAGPVNVLNRLEIEPPEAVIVIAAGANTLGKAQLRRLGPFFTFGIARAAKNLNAVIIDGGTKAGIFELMGKAVDDQFSRINLIGVAPSGRVILPQAPVEGNTQHRTELDPNHSHFILVDCDQWGDETIMLYNLAEKLNHGKCVEAADGAAEEKIRPALTLLIGGEINDRIALKQALAAVREGWPLLVMEGSGPLPNEIASRCRSRRSRSRLLRSFSGIGVKIGSWFRPELQEVEAIIDEIVEEGQIVLFSMRRKPSDLEKLLVDQLQEKPEGSILYRAWQRFAVYDVNARRHQRTFYILKSGPIVLGVVATALILGQEFLTNNKIIQDGDIWFESLRVLIIAVPIIVTVFLAAERLFKSSNKWLLLRYYAEEIKKDIYSYRVLSALNPHQKTSFPDEEFELSAGITLLSQRLMRTEVNESAFKPYNGPIPPQMDGAAAKDDGLSPLDPEKYVKIRVNDQLNFYSIKTNRLESQLQPRQWAILILGAMGSLLAALGGAFQFWVPLTVAFVTSLTAYLEYQQVEQTIVKYNQSMTKLSNLGDAWAARSPAEKQDPKIVVQLVEDVEQVMQSEHLGWVQQMQTIQSKSDKPQPSSERKGPGIDHPDGENGKPARKTPNPKEGVPPTLENN